jgi:diguanylate cyclase (GGDEF)-like protein/PAS domain S-box-containing protein
VDNPLRALGRLRQTSRRVPQAAHESLPSQVYVSTVDALYSDARSLFAGTLSSALAAAVTFWRTGDVLLLACAALMGLIGVVRAAEMKAYARQPQPKSPDVAHYWERRYIVVSAAYVGLLGIWCFLCFSRTDDAAVHLISFAVVIAYLVGITGRNFSSDQLVVTQTICAAVPMIAALLMRNSAPYFFLAALLVPFFLSIRIISARLRGILFDAVIASHEIKTLATQFDTALNNMPQGLCMLDANQRFVVANQRFATLFGLNTARDRRGMAGNDLLAEMLSIGLLRGAAAETFAVQFLDRVAATRRTLPFMSELGDGRTLELAAQPMEAGGCVLVVEDITERRIAEAKIEHLARFDSLTGLPNRTFLTEQFDRLLAEHQPPVPRAVLFVDLDEFKQVNDTLGHPLGDGLLCAVAERLRKVVRESDVVARFGGDEFVVLQNSVSSREDIEALAARIIELLSEIYEIDGHQIMVGASIGIALAPEHGVHADQLLKSADIALYRAKAEGRGGWRFFEPDMDVEAQARRKLEFDLREAFARSQFELYYQPIIDVKSGRASVCEALLRWRHAERGMISPAEFIPVAEEMGLIVEIGQWVLREACRTCATWPSDVRVSVNLSPIQFRRGNVESTVRAALADAGLSPERLELEITETVLLQDTPTIRLSLERLQSLGVRIALDDFGTGYSSLSYLQSFHLDKVKIDRSFLVGIEVEPRAMTLLRGVARLSADLGMDVIVEGVETQQQLVVISAERSVCGVQGFLFSRPVPAPEIAAFLGSERQESIRVA